MKKKNRIVSAGLLLSMLLMTACGGEASGTAKPVDTTQGGAAETAANGKTEEIGESAEEKAPESGVSIKASEKLSESDRPEHVPVYLETVGRGICDGETGVQKVSNKYVELSLDE